MENFSAYTEKFSVYTERFSIYTENLSIEFFPHRCQFQFGNNGKKIMINSRKFVLKKFCVFQRLLRDFFLFLRSFGEKEFFRSRRYRRNNRNKIRVYPFNLWLKKQFVQFEKFVVG